MSSLSQEASQRFNALKKANPGMTTNQALIAMGGASMVDLNNQLYDTGVSSADVPVYQPTNDQMRNQKLAAAAAKGITQQKIPLTPEMFARTLLRQVAGVADPKTGAAASNPNNLNSARVLQLVRKGVEKPEFMQEYLDSGGSPPLYSVLGDSEYMDLYNTQQLPVHLKEVEPDNPIEPDYQMPVEPDNGSLPDGSQPPVEDVIESPAFNPMMQTYVPPAVNPPMAQYVPPLQQPQPQPTFVPYQAPIPQVASEGLMGVPVMPSYNPAMYQAPTLPTTSQSYSSIMQRLLRGPEIV